MGSKGYLWYVPIAVVLLAGFVGGAALSFGVTMFGFLPGVQDESARLTMAVFGIGMVGATTFLLHYWSAQMEEAVYKRPQDYPHFLDALDYLLTIIAGGFTGIILYYVVKTGLGLSAAQVHTSDLNEPASLVIGYCGGLFHHWIRRKLKDIAHEVLGSEAQKRAGTGRTQSSGG